MRMKLWMLLALVFVLPMSPSVGATTNGIQKGEMAGYLLVPNEKVPEPTTPGSPCMSLRGRCWKKPGPKAGPFTARLGDGSVVTCYWYRFADQPSLLNADLTDHEREALQVRAEKLHRSWKKDREYLAPPAFGKLAELDPARIVTPPPGLEVGYVPIVTRQELAK